MTELETENKSADRLQAKGITVRFGATIALEEVDFGVAAGEIHALLGENGAGKSTLMHVLAGTLCPDAGTMALDGISYFPKNPLEGRLDGVAMIHQELSLAPHLTVAENICLGLEPQYGLLLNRAEMRARAKQALAKLGHTGIDPDARVGHFSVSVQQLIEIARSIALGCRVLILDEPTSSLTRPDVMALFDLLQNLKRQGYAIIYISHFLEEVKEIADRFTVLRDGHIVSSGSSQNVTTDEIIAIMTGNKLENIYNRSVRSPGEVVLDVVDLMGAGQLKSATLNLRRGEVMGIAGLVGSGRTELVRAIFGLDVVQTGTIKVFEHSGWANPSTRWQEGIGFLSENRKDEGVALSMDITDNIILTKTKEVERNGFLLPLKKQNVASKWIERLSIKCLGPQAKLRTLSGGNQQKVALARLLYHQADILILDEPTRGIDVKTKSQIYSLIDELAHEGKAILMISSYLPELLGVCDRIAVMHRGRLGPARAVAELTEQDLMLDTVAAQHKGEGN